MPDTSPAQITTKAASAASPWTPLRLPLFRGLWLASIASNVGTWMQSVGAAWLMIRLAPSPLLVALVQTAATLPVFLVALPAGALADAVDRRRLLLVTQSWMLAAAAILGVITLLGGTTPLVLLLFTFLLGLGDAMNGPAWASVTPEVVPRSELPTAIALNSAGYNVARAVGPALGGLVVAAVGSGSAFLINAASFLGVIFVLYSWHRAPRDSILPTERVLGAVRAGLRYIRYAPALSTVFARTAAFVFFAGALWALLPLVALRSRGQRSTAYGILLGCLGLGAVLAAFILPRLRQKMTSDTLVAGATFLFAAATTVPSFVNSFPLLSLAMLIAGVGWMSVLSSFNAAVQLATPSWVQARALAAYILILQGSLALGSLSWGALANRFGIPTTLGGAAAGMLLGLAFTNRRSLAIAEGLDLAPLVRLPDPLVQTELDNEEGPVMVTVEYVVEPHHQEQFTRAVHAVHRIRRRDGAIQWGLFHDVAEPKRFVETFVVESWVEHLRQRSRATVSDRALIDLARSFHSGERPPQTTRFIYQRKPEEKG